MNSSLQPISIPGFCAEVGACYGYSDRLILTEIERLLTWLASKEDNSCFHNQIQEVESDVKQEYEEHALSNQESADVWVSRVTTSVTHGARALGIRRTSLRAELDLFRTSTAARQFTASESREFWADAQKSQIYPRLGRLARLFLTVPASAIPQERQFSELKRRCAGLRNRTKVETLDPDAVVFSCFDASD